MYLPRGSSKAKRQRVLELLTELQAALEKVKENKYVQDCVTAGEIFRKEDFIEKQFVIDPSKKPQHAHERTYNDSAGGSHKFNERCHLKCNARA